MMKRDLIDCLYQYQNDIGPCNALRESIVWANNLQFPNPAVICAAFKGIGECYDFVLNPANLGFLDNYYTVLYKPNLNGNSGPQFEGSINYTHSEYRDRLLSGSPDALNFVNSKKILDILQQVGLTKSPVIITIKDTSIDKTLVVDGTKRALALEYFRRNNPSLYAKFDFSRYPIKLCSMSSPVGRILFPLDFWKLI